MTMTTIWRPSIEHINGPRYLALVQVLQSDIEHGLLKPGMRLPTHRDLAKQLGVTVGTVSRAYAEAERRGLTGGEVGRGTYVKQSTQMDMAPFVPPRLPGLIDLSVLKANEQIYQQAAIEGLARLARHPDIATLLTYQPMHGIETQRHAASRWLHRFGFASANPDQIVLTSGAQHGLSVCIAALSEPGELILTENHCYTGISGIASQLHRRRVQGIEMDDQGLIPESLAQVCKMGGARLLVCVPNLHNPTTATMSEARRHEIIAVAREYDLKIIEDDVCGFLLDGQLPTLAQLAPERTCYVTGLAKSIMPSLRIGIVHAPYPWNEVIASAVRTSTWMTSPLMAELFAQWENDGTAERLAGEQRQEAIARQRLACQYLGHFSYHTHPQSMHMWLDVPEPWRVDHFVTEAQNRNVSLVSGDLFAVARYDATHAVRLCLSSPATRDDLVQGLTILAEMLGTQRIRRQTVV